MAGSKDLRYNVTVDSSGGISGLRQFSSAAKRELKSTTDALEDTRTAGEKVADVLSAMATKVEGELKEAATAAEALSKALGPDLAGRADVGSIVADLNRMGLTFDEITADADKLAASLKQVDGVRMSAVNSGLQDVDTSLGTMRSEADQSRSVLANMAGNAAQDIGALGGVAGTTGVAIGQLAEYATEGGISLKGLAGVAGPMLGLALATQAVSSEMEEMRRIDAFNKERVTTYFDAIRNGEKVVETLRKELEETGELNIKLGEGGLFGGAIGGFTIETDLVPQLRYFNLTLEDFQDLIDKGVPGIEAWGRAQREAGSDSNRTAIVVAAMTQELENQEEAADRSAATTRVLARELTAADFGGGEFAKTEEEIAEETNKAADAAERHTQALQDEHDRLTTMADAFRTSADAVAEANSATAAYGLSLAGYDQAVKDAGDDLFKLNEIIEDNKKLAIGQADATVAAYTETLKSQGITIKASDATALWNGEMLKNAASAKGPLRQSILDYIGVVNGIPPEKVTEILAALDRGDVDEANRLLNEASRKREAEIAAETTGVQSAEAELNRLARERAARVVVMVDKNLGMVDQGGTVGPGGGIAAEIGPEIARLPGGRQVLLTGPSLVPPGTRVTSRRQTARILGLRRHDRGTGVTINVPRQTPNITLNAAVIGNRFDVQRTIANELRRYERLNGRRQP